MKYFLFALTFLLTSLNNSAQNYYYRAIEVYSNGIPTIAGGPICFSIIGNGFATFTYNGVTYPIFGTNGQITQEGYLVFGNKDYYGNVVLLDMLNQPHFAFFYRK